jgi:hypothetical protein
MGHASAGRATALPDLEVRSARPAADTAQYPGVRRQEWFDTEGRLAAFGGGTATTWWMHWPQLGTFQFSSEGPVIAHPEPDVRPSDLRDTFERHVLPFVLIGREHEALHASAVANANGVSAFCAVSGTGKSSLAWGLASRRAVHWADDTLVLRMNDDAVRAVRLPFPARVDRAVVDALATGRGTLKDGENDPGATSDPRGSAANDSGATVGAGETRVLGRIYFVARDSLLDPARPSIRALEGAAVFERLLAHAHPFDLPGPERRRRMIERLLQVARNVPMYELRFAPDLTSLPRLIDAVGQHLASS